MVDRIEDGDTAFPLAALPKTAIQAIYNAVTGKTENLSKTLEKNVIINSQDIDRLHGMIVDQINIYPKISDPTVTVVVKNDNGKSVTYSSWERFKALRVNNHDMTSDVTLKFEMVMQLPETQTPQRCVVNVNLDSSLPVIIAQRKEALEIEPLGFLILFSNKWRTARISIDFVDFLVAKSFFGVVEEWINTLKGTPNPVGNAFIVRHLSILRAILQQLGRIGFAGFAAAVYLMLAPSEFSLRNITLAVSIGLSIWVILEIFENVATSRLIRRISSNIIPTVIILNDVDRDQFIEIESKSNSAILTAFNLALSVVGAVGLNVIASYIYAYLTR